MKGCSISDHYHSPGLIYSVIPVSAPDLAEHPPGDAGRPEKPDVPEAQSGLQALHPDVPEVPAEPAGGAICGSFPGVNSLFLITKKQIAS